MKPDTLNVVDLMKNKEHDLSPRYEVVLRWFEAGKLKLRESGSLA
jgi:hypothetical protein